MGFFDRFKKKGKTNLADVYMGKPHFYEKDGHILGVFTLTEETLSSFPKNPKTLYKVDDAEVGEWRLMLFSTTKDEVLGGTDFYKAIKKLMKFAVGENDGNVLIKGLSLEEMKDILQ